MGTHIIPKGDNLNTSIIWNSFRGSYTYLFATIPNLSECKIEGFGILFKKGILSFSMYNTNGFQEPTRSVIGDKIYSKEYIALESELNDSKLIELFDAFFNDYINSTSE